MAFKIYVTNEVNEKDWNYTLLRNDASTTYQTASWQMMFKEVYDSKPIFVTVENSGGEIVGQLAAIIHHNWFWKNTPTFSKFLGNALKLGTELHWFYGPIIHNEEKKSEIITQILQTLDKIAIKNNIIQIRGISPPLDKKPYDDVYKKNNYQSNPWLTYITDLRFDLNSIFNSFDKKTRYDIRKSEKNDLEFEVANKKDSYYEYHELKINAKKSMGIKVKNDKVFSDKHWELLNSSGYEKLLLTRHNGKIVGGILALTFNDNVVQHSVGISPPKNLLSGSFLTWNALRWAKKLNYNTFDMAGVNPLPKTEKEKNIDFFKSKWGGKKYDYFIFTKIFSETKRKASYLLKNPMKAKKLLRKC